MARLSASDNIRENEWGRLEDIISNLAFLRPITTGFSGGERRPRLGGAGVRTESLFLDPPLAAGDARKENTAPITEQSGG